MRETERMKEREREKGFQEGLQEGVTGAAGGRTEEQGVRSKRSVMYGDRDRGSGS